MLNIVLYSSNSAFLGKFSQELKSALGAFREDCRIRRIPLGQASFLESLDTAADVSIVDITDDPEGGLEFAENLPKTLDSEVMIVAPSAEYAMRAYNAEVLAYLINPPDAERAARIIIRRFSKNLSRNGSQLSIRTESGIQIIPARRIIYLEYEGHRVILHSERGVRQISRSMRSSFSDLAIELSSDARFVRTHAAYIINIEHAERIERTAVLMDNGDRVPISRSRRRKVLDSFGRFFRQGS